MQIIQSRRDFLASLSAAGAASVLGDRGSLADDGPPETTTIRLAYYGNNCLAPLLTRQGPAARGRVHRRPVRGVAGVLHDPGAGRPRRDRFRHARSRGTVVHHMDTGVPITALGGRSFRLLRAVRARAHPHLADLKGKRSRSRASTRSGHQYLAIMAAHIGLDPNTDFDWVISPDGKPMELFADGKADAFLAFPPEPQELRDRKVGRVIISTVQDRPWSQYFCCMLFGQRTSSAIIRSRPSAYLRALLKAADYCAAEPERVAQRLSDGGFGRYEYASRRSPRSSTGVARVRSRGHHALLRVAST